MDELDLLIEAFDVEIFKMNMHNLIVTAMEYVLAIQRSWIETRIVYGPQLSTGLN